MEDKMHGECIVTWPNGFKYEGQFEHDFPKGTSSDSVIAFMTL